MPATGAILPESGAYYNGKWYANQTDLQAAAAADRIKNSPSSAQSPGNTGSAAQYASVPSKPVSTGPTSTYTAPNTDSLALEGLKNETGVQTGAAKTLAQQQIDAEKAAAEANFGYSTQTGQQQFGFQTQLSDQAARIAQQRLEEQARLQAEAEARRLGYINQLQTSFTSSGPGASTTAPVDTSAAQAAAFGRAKDQAGLTSRAALDSLRSAYAGTGNVGGYQQGVGRMLNSQVDQLGEAGREQAIQNVLQAQQNAQFNASNATQQRGQNINYLQSLIGLLNTGVAY